MTIAAFFVAWLAAEPAPAPAQTQAQTDVDLELVLTADGSGSIDDGELRLQREGYAEAIASPRVLDAILSGFNGRIAVAYVEWGGATSQHTIVDWMVVEDEASARAFGDALLAAPRAATGWNSISGAIDYAAGLIADNRHEGFRKIIDVSADSGHYGGRPVQAARNDAVSAGVTINGLVVASRDGSMPGPDAATLEDHFRRDIIGGPGAFVMVADEKTSFAQAVLNKLLLEIAAAPPMHDPEH
ncbi:MAG TPA: DUF1194 domain-containing protein [Alphaproteobacteria bacterium]|nr:DUF1194 domain-containing protein [Alphaproteobacteria bacterium]